MRVFFSSDQHLGGKALIDLGVRKQFKTIDEMNNKIVNNWNGRVKEGDTVYNVGDFVSIGKDRGIEGSNLSAEEWEDKLNGRIIHTLGNHDANNSLKHGLKFAAMEAGNFKIMLVHRFEDSPKIGENLIICGHVHDRWSEQWVDFGYGKVLCINVGVDVRRFFPIRLDEVLAIASSKYAELRKK